MRISVTDRCNLRCRYCMPQEQRGGADDCLTSDEIVRIAEAGVKLGITDCRITGGEPLVRRDCVSLIKELKHIPGMRSVGLTTNGVLLSRYAEELKEAGLDSLNVSLDTTDRQVFSALTGRDCLDAVCGGIREAKKQGLPVKINAVNRKGADWHSLLLFAQKEGMILRFIEVMPIGYGKNYPGGSNRELEEQIAAEFGEPRELTQEMCQQIPGSGPAVYRRFRKLEQPVGFISAVHGKFCSSCNRVRLTSAGYLKLCLCYGDGADLGKLLRSGGGNSLEAVMRKTIFEKPAAHCFERPEDITETREMNRIGG